MIFDLLLIIMILVTLSRSSLKGCTEDMSFSIAFLVIVRAAGIAYRPLNGIMHNFVNNRHLSVYASYIVAALIAYFIYNSLVGNRIVEFGKKVPKTTGRVLTYIFSVFKTMIIYSLIFTFLYALPVLHKMPDKYISPKSQRIAYGILGNGTNDVFFDLHIYLKSMKNPIEFMERQKEKRRSSASQKEEAVKKHKGLEDFVKPEKGDDKK
ncbi:MAG: hypothetical protein R6V47_06720 [Candidatus Delongbacteria bacterium]